MSDDRIGPEHRTLWGRFLRYWLGPIYYWTDTLDDQRRPSHTKFTWTVAFFWMMGLFTQLDVFFIRRALLDDRSLTGTELGFLVAFGSLAVACAGGLNGFKVWSKRNSGTDALKAGIEADAKAVLDRRASVDGDHEPTD